MLAAFLVPLADFLAVFLGVVLLGVVLAEPEAGAAAAGLLLATFFEPAALLVIFFEPAAFLAGLATTAVFLGAVLVLAIQN